MMTDYQRIEKAIGFIREHFKSQPELEEVARQVHLSPFHFQRLFTDWAGVSPKKFLQFLTIEYAKQLLQQQHSLLDAAYEAGLSSSSRLHDLFISIEGMSPGTYKSGGKGLSIQYSFAETLFGDVIIASTDKGICHLSFADHKQKALQGLKKDFPYARLVRRTDLLQQNALRIFSRDWSDLQQIKLHLRGTDFQLKVWQSLLHIPFGGASTYSSIADQINNPRAMRAVGSAVGANPVAYLIPCHRVIRSGGSIGEYHWGANRKNLILGWEAAQLLQRGA